MGMKENWKLFVESAKAKAESHEKVAEIWNSVHNNLSLVLIFLSAITTMLAVLTSVPALYTAGVSRVTTMLSAVFGFLQPSQRRQVQQESTKEFRSLMLRMIRCETDSEYEELWKEYNKVIMNEPFLPKKYQVAVKQEYSMTPELMIIIYHKEDMVEEALADEDIDLQQCDDRTNLLSEDKKRYDSIN